MLMMSFHGVCQGSTIEVTTSPRKVAFSQAPRIVGTSPHFDQVADSSSLSITD